jgi:methanogenesis marker radical SAM protein
MVPVHLGYTSGKGFTKGNEAQALIDAGVREVSFTVFSTDPEIRRKYMNDRHSEEAIKNLRRFCESCDVYAAAVLLKGVNDGPVLSQTIEDLEEMGAKGLILMRFANSSEQGLILGNAPIIPGQETHTVGEFETIVTDAASSSSMRITGTPLWDPLTLAPFALARDKQHLSKLPTIRRGATLLTSSVAAPFLQEIFNELGGAVNVVATNKDVGCLMTIDDIMDLDLSMIKETVIVPGRMLAHISDIKKALTKDGKKRLVLRGPDRLSVDGEMSISMSKEDVIEIELEAFTALIEDINALGV